MTPGATTSLPLFLLYLCRLAAPRTFVALLCPRDTGNYSPGSNYQSNLSLLLLRRVYVQGRLSFFYIVTEGDTPDTVYGHFLCCPDVVADVCLSCMDFAATDILGLCPRRKDAIIWYNECEVQYSGRSFFSTIESKPQYKSYIHGNSVYPDTFGRILARLVKNATDSAIASDTFYATSYLPEMNVQVQCTPDLSRLDCRTCLGMATSEMGMFSSIKQSAQAFLPSCHVRHESTIRYHKHHCPPQ